LTTDKVAPITFKVTLEPEFFHFANLRRQHDDKKHRAEAKDFYLFSRHLCRFIKFDNARFGRPPNEPDFILDYDGKQIGAELTTLDPKIFQKGGFVQRGQISKWNAKSKPNESVQHFPWGTYSLRESLAAFKDQLDGKRQQAKYWAATFPERWLLMSIAGGSPFADVVGGIPRITPGRETEVADYLAKEAYHLHLICQVSDPFDYVILFTAESFLTFPARGINPHKLPRLRDEIVKRGEQASDNFLDWKIEAETTRSNVSFPLYATSPPTFHY
jgi:hypothetical protein